MSLLLLVELSAAFIFGLIVACTVSWLKMKAMGTAHQSDVKNAILISERDLCSRLGVAEERIAAAADTARGLRDDNLELKREIAEKEATLRDAAASHTGLQVNHSAVVTKLAQREAELAQSRASLDESLQEVERLRTEHQDLELREGTLAARLDEFQKASSKRLEDEGQLKEAFRLLSVDALSKSNEAFLPLAKQVLADQQREVKAELARKHDEVDELLQPMKEMLTKLQGETQALEVKREGAYEGLLSEVRNIKETHESLRVETHQLVSALRDSGTRGKWGAVQLKRCLEFAGMLQHCCFKLEESIRTEGDETQRPDCVVTLPGNRTIVIDAKTPMKAYLDSLQSTDEATNRHHLAQHARQLKTHLSSLQAKSYWKQFRDSPDFVICFLPVEALLSAALSQDPELITFEDGKVLLATPTTLIALMRVMAFGWRQIALARDAKQIHDLAVSIYDKLAGTHESFQDMGRNIERTAASWEKMRTQVEGRGGVFSLGKRLQKLDIGKDELSPIPEIQLGIHDLQSDDWKEARQTLLPALAAVTDNVDEHA